MNNNIFLKYSIITITSYFFYLYINNNYFTKLQKKINYSTDSSTQTDLIKDINIFQDKFTQTDQINELKNLDIELTIQSSIILDANLNISLNQDNIDFDHCDDIFNN